MAQALQQDLSKPPARGRAFAYVGGGDGRISVFRMDPEDGSLSPESAVDAGAIPSFLAFRPGLSHVYAVNEGSSHVAAFSLSPLTGALTFQNRVPSAGQGPAHLSVDATGRFVLVSNYGSGHIGVLPILSDGLVQPSRQTFFAGEHAHQIFTDARNAIAYVPCLGSDWVAQYRFDSVAGSLTLCPSPTVSVSRGAGPRHLALHPFLPVAYLLNELDSTLTQLRRDAATGHLSVLSTVSLLPPGFSAPNSGAAIWVHPGGRYAFASNRGHDSIAVFQLSDDGSPSLAGHTSTRGKTPRSFELDATGNLLLVANQNSDTLVSMRFDPASGTLRCLGQVATVASPQFVGIVYLP